MTRKFHGGNCCGISHLYDIDTVISAAYLKEESPYGGKRYDMKKYPNGMTHYSYDFDKALKIIKDQCDSCFEENAKRKYGKFFYGPDGVDNEYHCIEVTLTNQQMCFYGEVFEKLGFQTIFQFTNANSGNIVNKLVLLMNHTFEYNETPKKEVKPKPRKKKVSPFATAVSPAPVAELADILP